tara:strand:+ start:302 stop:931 length:630 start_codon:yes stop_codon:yes gene_type:complete
MKDQYTVARKRLSLGINAIGVIDTILNWKKLENCFGTGFKFSDEAKHEITHELAVQQVRLHELGSKDKPSEILAIQEAAKNLIKSLAVINQSGNSKIVTELVDMVSEKAGINFTQLENAIKALEVIETKASVPRPNDLYRDIIRKLVAILEIDEIPLALHVQSSLNKFMTELDKQMPETIFPASKANYIQEGRVRILKDYLRGHLRGKS